MDEQLPSETQRSKKSADVLKAELERRKRDLWKVFNPTNQDFEVVLNAAISPEVWTVPAAKDGRYGEATVPMYVAKKYFEEMTNKIIYAKLDRMVIEENDKRESKGVDKMDLHTAQYRFESRNLKNLLSKREQIARILNGGLVKEYGLGPSQVNRDLDRRAQKESFSPGDVFGDRPTTTSAKFAQHPPAIPKESTPNIHVVGDDPDWAVTVHDQAPAPTQNQTVDPKVATSLVCDLCGKECASEFGLQAHMRSHKKAENPAPTAPMPPDTVKVDEEPDDD